MIRPVLVAWCDECGREFGPKYYGRGSVYWGQEAELTYALGYSGWAVLFGDTDEQTSVVCSNCRRDGGDE